MRNDLWQKKAWIGIFKTWKGFPPMHVLSLLPICDSFLSWDCHLAKSVILCPHTHTHTQIWIISNLYENPIYKIMKCSKMNWFLFFLMLIFLRIYIEKDPKRLPTQLHKKFYFIVKLHMHCIHLLLMMSILCGHHVLPSSECNR